MVKEQTLQDAAREVAEELPSSSMGHPFRRDRRQGLVKQLVAESYRLVVAALPRAEQPVDAASFGAGGGRTDGALR